MFLHFSLCPISLEIMKDPVTVSTGITYDRESIEKWLFSGKNNTCPATKQSVFRRPKIPINKIQIVKLLNDAKSPQLQMKCIGKLRALAAESDANKRCIESAGAVEFLASIVSKANFTHSKRNQIKG
ncbi:E3 ubiquitin-protein ligase PUB23 [Vitis vinifera]|uniref:U-box domain-containing protein n=1 Tax=Vitis vinifera TaxID=29760 RepID=A0A438GLY8_VITVI|nr:E3 ubiquitin-protein ligase PUB23 [Vitis vinifera]